METPVKTFKLLFLCVFLSSCQSQDELKKTIIEWHGKVIIIPYEMINYKVLGKDVVGSHLWESSFKIFTYIDSVGCTSCQLGLNNWKQMIDSCKIYRLDIAFLFVVHSTDYDLFTYELLLSRFDYPVIYDYQNNFDKLNHFPKEPYRTFLLDKNNTVLLIGSPIKNKKIWELYKEVITQHQRNEKSL